MASAGHDMTSSPDILCCSDVGHAGQRDARDDRRGGSDHGRSVAAVADFLHANLNNRVPWELACSPVQWLGGGT
jgi:hypothetical protein